MLEILDIDGLLILDTNYNRIYGRTYTSNSLELSTLKGIKEFPAVTKDHIVLQKVLNDTIVVFYGSKEANEVFLNHMLNVFCSALAQLFKGEVSLQLVDEKYDYMVLMIEYFVYEGMFRAENAEDVVAKVPKRNFEDLKGMPIPKGFSSIFKKVKIFK
ncbi:hypothetical protein VCUG_00011 [Vavraia culicis subsp. floridensis]|uniref:Coatomer subunit zeta n=1 Tax=Vavraia culicis (isolate floridensis) TaxID=948595 RepID=L2GYJ6_VAVCU|nr:uncharacterized protein VCUG_00011 [Vavraia culicis subsp. floridensis]ELA48402.1 hypothetical protein VCUG_00011 [Vavraia culicis subsp. floridensis]